jgi:hypothetical protein
MHQLNAPVAHNRYPALARVSRALECEAHFLLLILFHSYAYIVYLQHCYCKTENKESPFNLLNELRPQHTPLSLSDCTQRKGCN